MEERDEQQAAASRASAADENVTRSEGQGEADEPDAPTAEEENTGMNTVLDANPLFGVQDDASEEG
ncbi:MAG: hypothetical protein WCF57_22745 [Pyrinomonadaceae bacterium]